jgi:DNA-binding protein Fis
MNFPPAEAPLGAMVRERLSALLGRLEGRPVPRLYRVVLDEVERGIFGAALERANGEVGTAARLLGVNRNTVARKARALGLHTRGRGRPPRR